MWIKNALVFIPLSLIVLLGMTVFFVPRADSVSEDPLRLNKHILYLPGDPEQMNPWLSTNSSDSDVFKFVMGRLLASNANYELEPSLAKVVRVGEEVLIPLYPDDNQDEIRARLEPKLREHYGPGFIGFRDYAKRDYDGFDDQGYVNDLREDAAKVDPIVDHLVLRFEPDPTKTYAPLDLPTNVLRDVATFLKPMLIEEFGAERFGSTETKFDQLRFAAQWYAKKYDLSLEAITFPEKPTPTQIEEIGNTLEALVQAERGLNFNSVYKASPETDIREHPVVMMQLHEGVRWHDFGEVIHPVLPNGQLHFVAKVEIAEGGEGELPVRLASDEDWKRYRAATKLKYTFDDGGNEVVDNDGKRFREETFDTGDVTSSFSFGRDPDVAAPRGSYAMEIRQMRVKDELNIEFLYNRRFSPALYHLSYAYIIPEHKFTREEWVRQCIVKGRGPSDPDDPTFNYKKALPATQLEFSRDPVGTGPMKLKHLNGRLLPRWKSGEIVVLERFDDYWRSGWKPLYQELELHVMDADMGQESVEITFRSGGLDRMGIRPHAVKDYEERRDDFHIVKTTRLNYEYFAFNMADKPFDELLVRQALTLAVDTSEIIKYINYDQGIRVAGPGYPTLPYIDEDYVPNYTFRQGPNKGKTLKEAGFKYWPYDLEEAKALLDEAGWKVGADGIREKNGQKLKFTGTLSGLLDPRSKAFNLAREKWKELDCEVEVEQFEWNVYIQEKILPRKYQMTPLGWVDGIDYDKSQLWHSKYLAPRGLNFVTYQNPEADKLMDRLVDTYDREEILELSRQLYRLIADDCPYVFLFTQISNTAFPRNMKWAKPEMDAYGRLILDKDGKPHYEIRSVIDPDLMKWQDGHRFFTMQMVRSEEPTPRDDANELVKVGDLKTTWAIQDARSKAENEQKNK